MGEGREQQDKVTRFVGGVVAVYRTYEKIADSWTGRVLAWVFRRRRR